MKDTRPTVEVSKILWLHHSPTTASQSATPAVAYSPHDAKIAVATVRLDQAATELQEDISLTVLRRALALALAAKLQARAS
jgi:hypothetical protein